MGGIVSMEKRPLLTKDESESDCPKYSNGTVSESERNRDKSAVTDELKLDKHVSLFHAVGIIVGTVIGSGIFISARGVTEQAGSVGASLLIWAGTGVYMLLQAWCYAELGTALPVAGGDYAFNFIIWGAFPAFMVAWIHVLLITPSAIGAISQTAALYIMGAVGIEDDQAIRTAIAVSIVLLFGVINGISAKLATRLNSVLSASKVITLLFLIITGSVVLAREGGENFIDAFEGTNTDVGPLSQAVLNAYFAYKGWEQVAALPEEMVKPQRDLPIALVISVSLITTVYVATNVAYFAVMTPAEVIASDAVAITFVERVFGQSMVWLISLGVVFSCMGTINAHALTDSRYLFAAARNNHVPPCFSMLHKKQRTPLPALMLLILLFLLFACIPSVELLLQYSSLALQVKLVITISGLLFLKWKRPDLERPVCVPWPVAVVSLISLAAMLVLSLYNQPLVVGIAFGLCALGLPAYGFVYLVAKHEYSPKCLASITTLVQDVLGVSPESGTPTAEQGKLG